MELTWLGTAGFVVKTAEATIAFDPFLSRGKGSASPFTPSSFENVHALFVGHGHFDHTYDIPAIAAKTDLRVFAPGLTQLILKLRGIATAKRCGLMGCAQAAWLGLAYPKGLVQSYLFESQGKKTLFLSTAGCSDKELKIYRALEIDYLLAPLQGHSQIQEIVAKQVAVIRPKVVIPHHHDDFFPPLSQNISVDDFEDRLKSEGFLGPVLKIPLFGSAQV
jgi:L-ascorbate metabolism protein UlaG (beta-lactamase superfamily)